MQTTRVFRLLVRLTAGVDMGVGWDKLSPPLKLATLKGIRMQRREKNLYDTGTAQTNGQPIPGPPNPHNLVARSADGSYNDLEQPAMGMAGARFRRNVPIARTYPDPEPAMLTPTSRPVSLALLTRHAFQPARTLTVLAAAWLQITIRD